MVFALRKLRPYDFFGTTQKEPFRGFSEPDSDPYSYLALGKSYILATTGTMAALQATPDTGGTLILIIVFALYHLLVILIPLLGIYEEGNRLNT